MSLKNELQQLGISARYVSRSLNLGASTVSDIVNGKYKGADSTKQKVVEYIESLKSNKCDMNPLLFKNAPLVLKALHSAIENRKFDIEEKKKLIEISEPINEYIKANNDTDTD